MAAAVSSTRRLQMVFRRGWSDVWMASGGVLTLNAAGGNANAEAREAQRSAHVLS